MDLTVKVWVYLVAGKQQKLPIFKGNTTLGYFSLRLLWF